VVSWPFFQLRNVLPPSHLSCTFVNFHQDPWTTQSTRVGTRSANHIAFPSPSTFGIRQMHLWVLKELITFVNKYGRNAMRLWEVFFLSKPFLWHWEPLSDYRHFQEHLGVLCFVS
jgi:hypothetical protein